MITKNQLFELSRKFKINETAVLREYVQLYFLSRFYEEFPSGKVFFKGGTAIHIIFGSSRFSEDLDFTVSLAEKKFEILFREFIAKFVKEEDLKIREKKSVVGKKYLIRCDSPVVGFPVFVNLDFSFREKVFLPQKTIVKTDFPVIFRSFVDHLGAEELLAEKIRALLTRKVARDIYDLWYLLDRGVKVNRDIVKDKLRYYKIKDFKSEDIAKRLKDFDKKDFVSDLRPFVSLSERGKLPEFFEYVVSFINNSSF